MVSNTRVGTHLRMPLEDDRAIFIFAWNKRENGKACDGERQSGFNTTKELRAVLVEPVYGAHHGTEVGLGFDRDVENSEERGGNGSSFGRGRLALVKAMPLSLS